MGFKVAGDPCLLGRAGARFANNSAHTSLVGLDLSANTAGAACTQAVDFAAYLTWDFGLITIKVTGWSWVAEPPTRLAELLNPGRRTGWQRGG
jgi:hypothetical protein